MNIGIKRNAETNAVLIRTQSKDLAIENIIKEVYANTEDSLIEIDMHPMRYKFLSKDKNKSFRLFYKLSLENSADIERGQFTKLSRKEFREWLNEIIN